MDFMDRKDHKDCQDRKDCENKKGEEVLGNVKHKNDLRLGMTARNVRVVLGMSMRGEIITHPCCGKVGSILDEIEVVVMGNSDFEKGV